MHCLQRSNVKAEVHHIAVFDDVVLAFQAPFAGFLGAGFALVLDEVVVGDHFGADEAFFEVGVDHGGGLRGGGADFDGPGADFLHACGEVGLQVEQRVTGADHAVQARLFHAHGFEEHLHLFEIVQFGDLGFDLVAHRHDDGAFFFGDGFYHVEVRVVLEAVFGDVGDVHHRLGGEQVEGLGQALLVVTQVFEQAARRLAFGEVGDELFQQGLLRYGFFVATLGGTGDALQLLLAAVEVGHDQLEVDDLDIALGVDAVGDVDDVLVFEAAHHVGDGVGLADVGEELVAQAFTFRRARYQAGDVDEFHGGGDDLFGLDDLGQGIQARVGHGHDAAVRLDGAEGEVLRRDAGFGEGVEQGGLADIGQADDAAVESHGVSLGEKWLLGCNAVHVWITDCP